MINKSTDHRVRCYVNKEGLAIVRCEDCGVSKTVDVAKHNPPLINFKANCKCGALIKGRFEYRKHYRKEVRFSGQYFHRKNRFRGEILIEDISINGAGFSCMEMHNLKIGDQLDITFRLDNPKQSEIKLWVEVKSVRGQFIGVQRLDTQTNQPDLGFYLK